MVQDFYFDRFSKWIVNHGMLGKIKAIRATKDRKLKRIMITHGLKDTMHKRSLYRFIIHTKYYVKLFIVSKGK